MKSHALTFTFLSVLLAANSSAMGKPAYPSKTNSDPEVAAFASGLTASSYWTSDRLKAAKPFPLPMPPSGSTMHGDELQTQASTGDIQSSTGSGPTIMVTPSKDRLFEMDSPAALSPLSTTGSEDLTDVQPFDEGTAAAPFTTSYVDSGYATLENQYAWRTVGKLFFTANGVDHICSAAVIQRRVIATAGHCVHSGNGSSTGWHSNFLFVPAYDYGAAPFKAWGWDYAITTPTWYNGGGVVPNAADYAMIQLRDQTFTLGGSPLRVGDVVGWLAWQTSSLSRNHTTKLGYPGNFADGQKMVQSMSNNFRNTSPNNVEYGSDMRGGSSGGPWVQNFNASCGYAGCGLNSGLNRLVGVTSYGNVSSDPKYQGASILDSRWTTMWNTICARKTGNCG